MRTWDYIVLHHSATSDGKTVDSEAIKRFHTSWRFGGMIITQREAQVMIGKGIHGVIPPWADVGYHFLIEKVGDVVKVIDGRSLEMDGAHTKEDGMNHKSIGICLIGNFNKPDETREHPGSGPPSEEKIIALGKLLVRLYDDGIWTPPTHLGGDLLDYIKCHRDYAFNPYPPKPGQEPYKLCPGSAFNLSTLKDLAPKYF